MASSSAIMTGSVHTRRNIQRIWWARNAAASRPAAVPSRRRANTKANATAAA